MKYLCILAIATLCSFASQAQPKEQKAVADAVEKLKEAMISGDRAALTAIAADSLSYGHSGGKVENKSEFVEAIASGKSDFVTIDLSEQTISIVGNTAIVRHTLNATTNDGGKPGTVKLKLLLVFTKEKTGWKMLARQAVKLV
ncbi:nuclear transport factor 2 family protein [Sediminibacterium roseum]|uniref:Nuclear transport factor 2 family protein n=1 Tax=Sediminibacterium roseum TaxID=1978412 RepID=A0ABW9ZWV1_9BACT|nr:nuclear transport factor 2 family protein [Sediminibacterium roseum]NCI51629.1 nuclear transport factor 2 family protein [Sediminibacterium roseum]